MIKITAKNGELNAEMEGSAFEILDEAIEITKAFYTSFNKHLPNFGDFYLHRINTELKEEENEEPKDFEKELVEIIEDMRKVMAEILKQKGEEENEKDSLIYPEHQRHRRH